MINRSRFKLIMETLTFLQSRPNSIISHIAYGTKGNFTSMTILLSELQYKNLVTITIKDNRKYFSITTKGKEALEVYTKLTKLFNNKLD